MLALFFDAAFFVLLGFLAGWLWAVVGQLHPLNQKLDTLMENQAELQAALDAANAQLTKIETEQRERAEAQAELIDALLKEVASLQEALAAGGPLTEGVKASFAALTANLQRFDDTIPDAPAAPLA